MKYFYTLVVIILLTFTVNAQLTQIRVACIGNSITQGSSTTWPGTLGTLLGSHYNVKNYGVGGATLLRKGDKPYWTLSQFFEAQDFDPHIIIISLGTNDSKNVETATNNWKYGSEFYSDYIDFIHTYRKNGRKTQIYVCYPPPAFQDNFSINDSIIHYQIIPIIDSVRRMENTLLIDWYTLMAGMSSYFADGIHPSNAGYAIMGGIVRDTIMASPGGFIRTFNASPRKYEQGDSVKLYWETSQGSQVTINGSLVNETDSMVVYPTGTVPYTLIAKGPHFADTSLVTLEYVAPGKVKSLNANPPVLEKDAGDSTRIKWTTAKGSTVKFENVTVSKDDSIYVKPTVTQTYTLVGAGEITDTARITVPVMDAELINRAAGSSVVSSTFTYGYPAANAIDGDAGTSWMCSSTAAGQWIYVLMSKVRSIDRVVLKWGTRYATSYIIQSISATGSLKTLYTNTTGDGGIDDFSGLIGTGRGVRLQFNACNLTDSGYTIKEFEIYTPSRSVDVKEQSVSVPKSFSLFQNYPNPFNPSTTINFSIPVRSIVHIKIFNLLGQLVTELVNSEFDAGSHIEKWNASASSGLYFYRMEAASIEKPTVSFSQTRAMLVVK
jgi:acyl-CoA thioesterase I